MIGGTVGTTLGYFGSFVLTDVASSVMLTGAEQVPMEIVPTIDANTILLVAGICVTIGIVFGFYPAYRAAKMDPAESLHYQ